MRENRKNPISRRDFIKISGFCIGGTALGFLLPACETSTLVRVHSLSTALKMFHCAPTIMESILHFLKKQDENMVKLAAGLPGGIGGLDLECGGVTSPVMVMGLEFGYDYKKGEVPKVLSYGLQHVKNFKAEHGSLMCGQIQRSSEDACKNVIATAPYICLECLKSEEPPFQMEHQAKEAYIKILNTFGNNSFHCSQSVLRNLSDIIEINEKVLSASYGFMGGTLLQGLTCGALTAGVLAIGAKFGEIEDSYQRVIRMFRMIKKDKDFMKPEVNKFHTAIMIGNVYGEWFIKEFGSSQCRDITQCDFALPQDADRYINDNKIEYCKNITEKAVIKLREILKTPAKQLLS
jgi:C_GCAxxG_C_C family probable redox protein